METQLKAMCINKEAFITQPGTGKLLALAAVRATGVFHGLPAQTGDIPPENPLIFPPCDADGTHWKCTGRRDAAPHHCPFMGQEKGWGEQNM